MMKLLHNVWPHAFLVCSVLLLMPGVVAAEDSLDREIARRGTARVLVRMALPTESSVRSGLSRAASRRSRIAVARDRVARSMGRPGSVEVLGSFSEIPWVAVETDAAGLESLRNSPDVVGVTLDRLERVSLESSVALIGAGEVNQRGLRGAGWGIAIVDTGVESDHPVLAGRVIREACFSAGGSCPDGSTEMIGPGAAEPCHFGEVSCSHGTHVAGIAAGGGYPAGAPPGMGVAPGANIFALQVFSEFTGEDCEDAADDPCALAYLSDITRALEYVYAVRDELPIAAVNLSLGGELFSSVSECESADPRTEIVALLREAGIAVVAAAGNESSLDSLTTPACLSDVLSVSSTNDQDEISGFSNTAPFLDFFAPGDRIRSAYPGGGFRSVTGSSQSAPHVAAAYALLFEALGTPELEVSTQTLLTSGLPIVDDIGGGVYPRIRIDEALRLLELDRRGTGLQTTPDGQRTLLSKELGNERWAIVLNANDGSVSGNVFLADGGDPAFVSCVAAGDDGGSDVHTRRLRFNCEGAPKCDSECTSGSWQPLGSVELPGSFFLPRPKYPLPKPAAESCDAALDSKAGVREIPGRNRVLVSKDAGGKRWAIAWNEDGSVTGNVYDPEGGAPQFVWCEDLGDDGNSSFADRMFRFRCAGADPCFEGTCNATNWTDLGGVSLPGSFFTPSSELPN